MGIVSVRSLSRKTLLIPVLRTLVVVIIMESKAPDGFTLIELLVSVAIIIVMTGGIVVNYNSYNDSQRARAAALTVKNNLRFAQGRAYNGEKPSSGCTQLNGYQVSFTATTYSIQAMCSEGLAGEAQIFSLETGITFSPVPSSITFRVLSRGIDTDTTIIIVGSSKSYQFLVSRSGDMSEVTLAP